MHVYRGLCSIKGPDIGYLKHVIALVQPYNKRKDFSCLPGSYVRTCDQTRVGKRDAAGIAAHGFRLTDQDVTQAHDSSLELNSRAG